MALAFDNEAMRDQPTRREVLMLAGWGGLWPPNWFHRHVRLADASFRIVSRGIDRRRYIWIHGDERTAHDVLRDHMRSTDGRAFLIENKVRNVELAGGSLDPNRMFSRVGAEQNLKRLNPAWDVHQVAKALNALDRDRNQFVRKILPSDPGGLMVALHNNGPGYSVQDEVGISDKVALNDAAHPDEFMLCTMPADFEKLAEGPYNVLLQNTAPPDDDGSLSRLCAARNFRYVNIEAAHGNAAGQRAMLQWLESRI
jgi:hypothetical protein